MFVAFLVGRDQRHTKALASGPDHERRRRSPFRSIALATLVLVFFLVAGSLFFLGLLYLVKMWAGVDLVGGSSPIPELLKLLNFCH